jgi:hypothetical protein
MLLLQWVEQAGIARGRLTGDTCVGELRLLLLLAHLNVQAS